jgi:hypothetical protein
MKGSGDEMGKMKELDIYVKNGYASRSEYLMELADNSGADYGAIAALADLLGPNEDFDGLVTSLEDMGLGW